MLAGTNCEIVVAKFFLVFKTKILSKSFQRRLRQENWKFVDRHLKFNPISSAIETNFNQADFVRADRIHHKAFAFVQSGLSPGFNRFLQTFRPLPHNKINICGSCHWLKFIQSCQIFSCPAINSE